MLVNTLTLSYQLAKRPVSKSLKGHSSRDVAASAAFPMGICETAMWAQSSTFLKLYRLDTRAKLDAPFGRTVISSVLA